MSKRLSSLFKIEDDRVKKVFGFLFLFSSLYLIIVLYFFLNKWPYDQDKIGQYTDDISNFGMFLDTVSLTYSFFIGLEFHPL